jgi:hypothetical protein
MAPPPPAEKRGGAPSALLIGCGVAALLLLVVGALGGIITLAYLLGGSEAKAKDTQKEQPKADAVKVVVDEDFRTTLEKKLTLPEGWTGDAFRVVKDNEEPCLEVGKATGEAFVTVPLSSSLSGNFAIEGVFLLDQPHKLVVRLESRKTNALLPIVFDSTGKILIGDDARSAPPNYKPHTPTQFLLQREGKKLRVFLNGEPAADKELEGVTEFEILKLGMNAGKGFRIGRESRLFRLKVTSLGANGTFSGSGMSMPNVSTGRKSGGSK